MDKIIAVKNFTVENKWFFAGDEISINDVSKSTLIKLNQKGFIEPLSQRELMEILNNI